MKPEQRVPVRLVPDVGDLAASVLAAMADQLATVAATCREAATNMRTDTPAGPVDPSVFGRGVWTALTDARNEELPDDLPDQVAAAREPDGRVTYRVPGGLTHTPPGTIAQAASDLDDAGALLGRLNEHDTVSGLFFDPDDITADLEPGRVLIIPIPEPQDTPTP
jgi:hypothetical protein